MNLANSIICIAIILQSLEHLFLSLHLKRRDPWRGTLPAGLETLFPFLIALRAGAAVAQFITPNGPILIYLLISTWIIGLRYRGSFNGGSDAMTFHVLLGLLLSRIPYVEPKAGAIYVALHSCLSYFFAGVYKIGQPTWRDGQALRWFLTKSNAGFQKVVFANSELAWARMASWLIIFYELAFPLSLVSPGYAYFFLTLGALFHLGNFWCFGLNRFVFAWISTYPVIFFLASR